MNTKDPFHGDWELNREKSRFDSHHQPASAIMHWYRTTAGYEMTAEGTTKDGKIVQERTLTLIPDGRERAVLDEPGVTAVVCRPVPNTVEVESKCLGRVVGKASYVVSENGSILTASVSSGDSQQRPFQIELVWDRL
jgi:hypothetical protein